MKLAIRFLAIALLTVLAATPTNAAKDQTAFRVQFDVLRSHIFDTGFYTGTFHASGALNDSGSATTQNWPWAAGTYLAGTKGELLVSIFPTGEGFNGAFTITGFGGAYEGLTGSGTARGTLQIKKRYDTMRWVLEGFLGGA